MFPTSRRCQRIVCLWDATAPISRVLPSEGELWESGHFVSKRQSGGNQSDAVTIAAFPLSRITHVRRCNERSFITRALAVVAPDVAGILDMQREGKANILMAGGWYPSAQIDWSADALPPLSAAELVRCEIPH